MARLCHLMATFCHSMANACHMISRVERGYFFVSCAFFNSLIIDSNSPNFLRTSFNS